MLSPMLLNRMLQFLSDPTASIWEGVLWSLALFCNSVSMVCFHPFGF